MELNKVMEGFTVSNNLVIKAQVQVIRCGAPPMLVLASTHPQLETVQHSR